MTISTVWEDGISSLASYEGLLPQAADWEDGQSSLQGRFVQTVVDSGVLTLTAGAVNTGLGGSIFNCPFAYREIAGDFDIETKILSINNDADYECAGIVVRDLAASAGEDSISVRLGFSSSPVCYARNVVNSVDDTFYYEGQSHRCFRIKREGQVFSIYSKAAESDQWGNPRKVFTRVSPNEFASTVQVGLFIATGNVSGTLSVQFEYIKQAGSSSDGDYLSGYYLSPVYDRGSIVTRRSWLEYDILFKGTGAAWQDQFEPIDLWTDKFSPQDSWLNLFGAYTVGTLKLKFGISINGNNWTWYDDFENFVVEAQGRYVRCRANIEDVSADGYLCLRPVTYEEAFWA